MYPTAIQAFHNPMEIFQLKNVRRTGPGGAWQYTQYTRMILRHVARMGGMAKGFIIDLGILAQALEGGSPIYIRPHPWCGFLWHRRSPTLAAMIRDAIQNQTNKSAATHQQYWKHSPRNRVVRRGPRNNPNVRRRVAWARTATGTPP